MKIFLTGPLVARLKNPLLFEGSGWWVCGHISAIWKSARAFRFTDAVPARTRADRYDRGFKPFSSTEVTATPSARLSFGETCTPLRRSISMVVDLTGHSSSARV